jgi:hypothetical protein
MRTKALLLAAAFAAAGIATSSAQVFSVNAVGYVNTPLKAGFNLVSNPLKASDNKISTLFLNIKDLQAAHGGTTVYKFISGPGGGFKSALYDDLDNSYSGDAAAMTTEPGGGVFVFLAGSGDSQVTFVGEVVQGGNVSIPVGFSILSSIVPQSGSPDASSASVFKNTDGTAAPIPANDGDALYRYDTTIRNYKSFLFDFGAWTPAVPALNVGEAVFYFRTGSAGTWARTFSVNS